MGKERVLYCTRRYSEQELKKLGFTLASKDNDGEVWSCRKKSNDCMEWYEFFYVATVEGNYPEIQVNSKVRDKEEYYWEESDSFKRELLKSFKINLDTITKSELIGPDMWKKINKIVKGGR